MAQENDSQDDFQENDSQGDFQENDSQAFCSLIEEDKEFENEINITDFILEKPKLSESLENKFSLYFVNFTEMSFFIWVMKHSITTMAYQELVKIILHDQFVSSEMPQNIYTLRQY
ncbi:14593_t:CDS:2 [Dentiscutata heterogama]|uniref:14593_t:CDS:1 n=1 Tax=Dentiscutata heterogama TaxID=1316150 RepID=A0ACA9JZ30_9GLOM|nr:14593_t:CDS:2 [Dentiscutata heterogama]